MAKLTKKKLVDTMAYGMLLAQNNMLSDTTSEEKWILLVEKCKEKFNNSEEESLEYIKKMFLKNINSIIKDDGGKQ